MKYIDEHSLNKRYSYKIFVSICSIPIGIIINSILPRSLGPFLYGTYSYINQTFAQIIEFMELGLGSAYYSKLSQNLDDRGTIKFFLICRFVLSSFLVFVCTVLIFFDLHPLIWHNIEEKYIMMGLIFAILNIYSTTSSTTVDAYGLTVKGEVYNLLVKIISLIIIIILFYYFELTLNIVFLYNYFITFLLILSWTFILKQIGITFSKLPKLDMSKIKRYINEFWTFSYPLIILSFVSSFSGFFDFWSLQKFGGPIEQGYYGLAFKISALGFIFARPMNSLITRELSVAFGSRNKKKMRNIFLDYIPLLFTVTTFFAMFISIESYSIIKLYGGEKFKDAYVVLSLLALYPIHQTYGQLSGSVFFASNQTKLYSKITISLRLIGIFLTIFFVWNPNFHGLTLGAFGLALKMIIYQFFLINIQLYFNSKFLSMRFLPLLFHQFAVMAIFYLIAFACSSLLAMIGFNNIIQIILCGFLYLVLSLMLVYTFPIIIYKKRKDLDLYKKYMIKKIASLKNSL